jgi:hypothetical protein
MQRLVCRHLIAADPSVHLRKESHHFTWHAGLLLGHYDPKLVEVRHSDERWEVGLNQTQLDKHTAEPEEGENCGPAFEEGGGGFGGADDDAGEEGQRELAPLDLDDVVASRPKPSKPALFTQTKNLAMSLVQLASRDEKELRRLHQLLHHEHNALLAYFTDPNGNPRITATGPPSSRPHPGPIAQTSSLRRATAAASTPEITLEQLRSLAGTVNAQPKESRAVRAKRNRKATATTELKRKR